MIGAIDPAKVSDQVALLEACSGGGAVWCDGVDLCKWRVEGRRYKVAQGRVGGSGRIGIGVSSLSILHEACEVRVDVGLYLGHEVFVVIAKMDDARAGGSY